MIAATRAPVNIPVYDMTGDYINEAQESPYSEPQVGDSELYLMNSARETISGLWGAIKNHFANSLFGDSIAADGMATPSQPDGAATPDVETPVGDDNIAAGSLTPQTIALVLGAGLALYLVAGD